MQKEVIIQEIDRLWIGDKFQVYDQLSLQTKLSSEDKFRLKYLKEILNIKTLTKTP